MPPCFAAPGIFSFDARSVIVRGFSPARCATSATLIRGLCGITGSALSNSFGGALLMPFTLFVLLSLPGWLLFSATHSVANRTVGSPGSDESRRMPRKTKIHSAFDLTRCQELKLFSPRQVEIGQEACRSEQKGGSGTPTRGDPAAGMGLVPLKLTAPQGAPPILSCRSVSRPGSPLQPRTTSPVSCRTAAPVRPRHR